MTPESLAVQEWVRENAGKAASELEKWYSGNARDFIWRRRDSPYVILVTEVLVKLTRAERVDDFLEGFLSDYPNLLSIEEADERALCKRITPLGLAEQKAKSLKNIAGHLCSEGDCRIPQSKEELIEVPGVGDYTASAVASFAFGQRVGIVDSNTIRIAKRLTQVEPTKNDERWCPKVRAVPTSLVDKAGRPETLNWALLDLGALVCKPRNPLCGECPLRERCGFAGDQAKTT